MGYGYEYDPTDEHPFLATMCIALTHRYVFLKHVFNQIQGLCTFLTTFCTNL